MSQTQQLLQNLWNCYYKMNSQVPKIHQALIDFGEKTIENDHIAFRTYAGSELGLEVLQKPFTELGWQVAGEYHFAQKKLNAIHLEQAGMPKIFLSELVLTDCSTALQDIVAQELAEYTKAKFTADDLVSGRWQSGKPKQKIYEQLLAESEYAAWVYIFGLCPNHFTVYVNALTKFADIDELNAFLLKDGFVMNETGGIVKGTIAEGLRQSSTMAAKVLVEFAEGGSAEIPCCYYEFAERHPINDKLFQGFVTASADKIFQSTDSK